jgi:putative ABC transport system permease protein
MLDLDHYRALFKDDGISAMAGFLRPGMAAQDVIEQIRALPGAGAVEPHSNRSLRQLSLQIFERTFQVTAVLRYLAIAVAFGGIFGALAALQLARQRDMTLYRALGLTPAQAAGLQLIQTTTAGLWAGLFAMPVGVCEAYAMVVFINRRAFGWNLSFALEPQLLLQAPLLALLASGLSGLMAARLSSRAGLSNRLQEE